MLELLLGLGLGAMAFTQQGRELGNRAAALVMEQAKKVMDRATPDEPAEQPPGASGSDRPPG